MGGDQTVDQAYASSDNVKVNVTDLANYAFYLLNRAMEVQTYGSKATAQLLQTSGKAFQGSGTDGAVPEAVDLYNLMLQHQDSFQRFFGDLAKGMVNISNAAQVISDSYGGTDAESAVGFAFADPGAVRPRGLPSSIGQTESDYLAQQQAAAGAAALALATDPDDPGAGAVSTSWSADHTSVTYTYADGSTLTQTFGGAYGRQHDDVTTGTVVKDGKGNVVGAQDEHSTWSSGEGSTTVTTKKDPKTGAVTETTTVTTHANGSEDITIEVPGQDPVRQHVSAPSATPGGPPSGPVGKEQRDTGQFGEHPVLG
jgi:hypothetical protein